VRLVSHQFLETSIKNMIKKIGTKYVVLSEDSTRRLGTYTNLAEAKARLQQVEIFKRRKVKG